MLAVAPNDPSIDINTSEDQGNTEELKPNHVYYTYWKRFLKFLDDNYFMCLAFFGIVFAAIVPFIGTPFYVCIYVCLFDCIFISWLCF